MRLLDGAVFQEFLTEKRVAAVHFDADWNSRHRATARAKMAEAEQVFGNDVNFGEIDVDHDGPLAKSIPVGNVPLIAYYLDGKLVAAKIGAAQDIRAQIERMLRASP